MTSLLTRLKEATGPDRELDKEIWLKLVPGTTRKTIHVDHWKKPYDIDETRDTSGVLVVVPSYTASLDFVLGLIDEVLPGSCVLMAMSPEKTVCDIHEKPVGFNGKWLGHADHSDKCLAALIALLTAMGETEDE